LSLSEEKGDFLLQCNIAMTFILSLLIIIAWIRLRREILRFTKRNQHRDKDNKDHTQRDLNHHSSTTNLVSSSSKDTGAGGGGGGERGDKTMWNAIVYTAGGQPGRSFYQQGIM